MRFRPKPLIVVIALIVVATIILRRRGYGVGGNTVVRCRSGHLFTTIWVPGASLKAVRLGWKRFQYCPVGRHWTLVTPVKGSDLSDEERRIASDTRDLRIP
jgi:hypothetical protein